MPKKQAQVMAGGMVDLMTTLLKNGDRVRITGLGILEVKDRPARTGRNPATGASIQIAASKKVAFRVAKELKEAV
jgi:DNA-binding protein HU-beta